MKKRRCRDFAGETTGSGNRRPYTGRVSDPGETENLARRELYEDVDAERQPVKPSWRHLSGGLGQCESLSAQFQWNNMLARDPSPNCNPSMILGLNRADLDYGHFDHGGFTSPLLKWQLDLRPIPYAGTLEDVPNFTTAATPSGYDRSRAMPRQNALVDYGGTSIALSQGFPSVFHEFNRARDDQRTTHIVMGHAGYSQGQTAIVDNAGASSEAIEGPGLQVAYSNGHTPRHGVSPIALNEGFPAGLGGYSQAHNALVDNVGGLSEAFDDCFLCRSRAMPVYYQLHAPRTNQGGLPYAPNEGFCGSEEFNKSRAMTEESIVHAGCSHGPAPTANDSVHSRWAQQSPKEIMSRDYAVPGMKRSENSKVDPLVLLDLLYKKMATVGQDSGVPGHLRPSATHSVREDSRIPSHLRPSFTDFVVHRVGGSNGSVGAGTQENCQLHQYHGYTDPVNVLPTNESTIEPSILSYDEVSAFSNSRTEVCRSNETEGFSLGVDVGHEGEVVPLSYEGNLQGLALPEEDQGLLEVYGGCQQRLAAAESMASMTPLRRWALRKVAMKEHQSGNHSKSKFFPDLNPSFNTQNSGYDVDIPLTTTGDMIQQYAIEDIQQYGATSGADQWKMEQHVSCRDGQHYIDQGVTVGLDQRNISQGSIDQGVTSGEDQCNIHQGVISGVNQWNNDHGATTYGEQLWRMDYGENQWNDEHINNLNTESLLPDPDPPASVQEHYGEQSKSARIHVKKRLGLPKISSGSIKMCLGSPLKSPGSVKMRLGPSSNDPNINIVGCKAREQHKSQTKKTDGFSGSIHPPGNGFSKKKDVAARGIHPQGSALPQVKTDSFSGSIHPQGVGLSKVKSDFTGSIHSQGNAVPNIKKCDLNRSIHPKGNAIPNIKKGDLDGSIHPQGGSVSNNDVGAAKKEPPEDSKDFKKLVDDSFIKFINILVENPTQRRKFMEGKGWKCCVCPSNSKEFVETATLARHAFLSPKVGLKAEHLGFHQAVCVLLGWDIAAVTKNMWVQRNLPEAEALALKEDLVIWPPVVVIHNSSLVNKTSEDEGLTVNAEVLEAFLTGIGFLGKKTNVYCGKPANGSVMVVKFQPTFSGLQEAEKLHKLFADNKHGKAEWRYISSIGGSNSSNGKQESEADDGNCLYGYLGNVEDWDEVDLGTKKHFQVKSKKQIKAIANASL